MRGSFIQSFRESTSSFLTLLGCAVTITLIGFMGASGTDRMIYHPGFEVPLTCLCALVWLCAIRKNAISSKYWLCCDMLIKIAAACNIMLLIYCYFPFITQPETREYRYMFTPWDYEAQKKAVMEAYYACGFPPLTEAKHLVIDNYSSPVLKHSYEPFDFDFATNLTLYTYGGDINVNDLFSLMKRYQSDGILLNCRHVTTNLAPFIEKHGDYCCVPPATIWKYHPLQSGNKGTLP